MRGREHGGGLYRPLSPPVMPPNSKCMRITITMASQSPAQERGNYFTTSKEQGREGGKSMYIVSVTLCIPPNPSPSHISSGPSHPILSPIPVHPCVQMLFRIGIFILPFSKSQSRVASNQAKTIQIKAIHIHPSHQTPRSLAR